MREKHQKKTRGEIFLELFCILVFALVFIRVFLSTDITDEAYYISDALAMINGNIPYAYANFSYGTGSAFLLIPLLFVYQLVIPTCQGIVLYSRICYMLIWGVILLIVYKIVRRNDNKQLSLFFVTIMSAVHVGVGILNLGYNTIPAMLAFLSAFLLYDYIENECGRPFKVILVGFLMGIAFFAHPGYALAILWFAVLILIKSKGKQNKLKNLLLYALGGFSELGIVMGGVALSAGIDMLFAGLKNMFFPYASTISYLEANDSTRILVIFGIFIVVIVGFGFGIWFFQSVITMHEKKRADELQKSHILNRAICLCVIAFEICFTIILCLRPSANWLFGMLGVGISALLYIYVAKLRTEVFYFCVYQFFLPVVMTLAIDTIPTPMRFWACLPAFGTSIWLLMKTFSEAECRLRIGITITTACVLCFSMYNYIYRDASIFEYNTVIDKGVYAGLITTQDRADSLTELEDYLNSQINENDYYAYRDNVPAAYLMTHKGKMCCESTWDKLNYSYGISSPVNLYDYYERREQIPTKIIYVDFGRDEMLSIDDERFLYNEFVNTYYVKTDEREMNSLFTRVIVYQYVGGFYGDYQYWIEKHSID